ncbi:MAG: TIGR04282 family arsenosugar biosynthesis glycosyltransferase [bacterium]
MDQSDERCIILFVKYPEKDKVKKRLSEEIGADAAVALYNNFVLDLLASVMGLSIPLWVCFYPPDHSEKFSLWLGSQYHFIPQKGKDLGERMKNAFSRAFEHGFRKVVLIGSDIPDLPMDIIDEAFLSLDPSDMVIGPTCDGGYYLIGFGSDRFVPEIFEGITWGAHTVLKETLDICILKGKRIYALPEWQDVDTLSDLRELEKRNQNTPFSRSGTMAYISAHQHILREQND